MITWVTASARHCGITSSGQLVDNPRLRIARYMLLELAAQSCTKTLSEIRNPLHCLPRHETPWAVDAAEKVVRNLVKEKIISFCWETPSVGTFASARKCTVR